MNKNTNTFADVADDVQNQLTGGCFSVVTGIGIALGLFVQSLFLVATHF